MSLNIPPSPEPVRPNQPAPAKTEEITNLTISAPEGQSNSPESSRRATSDTKKGLWGPLRLLERSEFDGSNREFTALNNGLLRAWNRSNPLSWIMARVRCEILKLPPHQYSTMHGLLSHSTLAGLESPRLLRRARFDPETIHLLLKGWENIAAQHKASNPHVSEMLSQAKREILLTLTKKHGRSVYGVLARWRYEVGPQRFDTLSGYSYKTMWGRKNLGLPFEFGELLRIGRSLGFIKKRDMPPKLWDNPRVKELEEAWMFDSAKLGRPKELGKLYKLVEACGLKVTQESLHQDPTIKLQSIVINALNRFEIVSWKKVQPLFTELRARKFITESDLQRTRRAWIRRWNLRPETFERRLCAIRDERGFTNAQLADALGLAGEGVRKPALPVYRALSYGERSSAAPFGVLAHLIGRTHEEVQSLLSQKREEILAQWRRQGSSITSPVAVERELWSIDYPQLSFPKSEIQKLEWGRPCSLQTADVVAEISSLGDALAKSALERIVHKRDLSTVRGAISSLISINGYAPLARLMETSVPLLQNLESGAEVPTYPKLQSFIRLCGFEPSIELEMDWREQFARHLIAENHNDLQRVLNAYIAEHGTSRRALLQSTGARSSDVARHFHWISEVGVVEPKAFADLTDLLGLDWNDPTRIFLNCVATEGSIHNGLTIWIREMDRQEGTAPIREHLSKVVRYHRHHRRGADSIEKLRNQITLFERTRTASSRSADVFKTLRCLPGVTIAEIDHALGQHHPDTTQVSIPSLLDRCRKKGLSNQDLLFSLRTMVPSERRPLQLLQLGIVKAVASPVCPPAVLSYLGAESAEAAQQEINALRSQLLARVSPFAIPGAAAVVEMMLWGIRREDLSITPKDFARAIWCRASQDSDGSKHENETSTTPLPLPSEAAPNNESSAQRIEAKARDLGIHKARTALKELLFRRTSVLPWQLVEIAVQGLPGRDKAYSMQGGFRIGAASQFISGKVAPTPSQLGRTVELAGLPLTESMRLAWSDSFAKFLQTKTAPLGRILLCQIVAREFQYGASAEPNGRKTLIDNIVSTFLKRSGLPVIASRRALHRACVGAPIQETALEALGAALGHKKGSPGMTLLRIVSGTAHVGAALFEWCERASAREAALEPFLRLGTFFAKEREQQRARLDRGIPSMSELVEESLRAVAPDQGSLDDDLMTIGAPFIGFTKDEILAVSQRVRHELLEGNTTVEAPTEILAPWKKETELYTLPVDQRWDIIARRLMDGQSVSVHDLLDVLARFAPIIGQIETYVGQDTPWFVAAAAFYNQPDDALLALLSNLRQGKESRHTPQDFLQRHATWVQSRGPLGKLSATSMGINFREPIRPLRPNP